ncbi:MULTISPECIES: C1 family peptidase [unclassified Flavonifractor]|uniref:aminopeptidase C n=1 Tax=Flavonifractor sp. An92 TaxID=1965666 RepID=UPI001302BBDC|nr:MULTISPECIES: C1 family peptidase [unclassified Flavonifractor]
MEKQIKQRDILSWQETLAADPLRPMRQNCLAHTDLKQVAIDQSLLVENRPCFSLEVEGGSILAQNKTGRCWLFSALNILRVGTIRKQRLKPTFAFSVNYLNFWDKLEKANLFLERILEHLEQVPSGDYVRSLLRFPVQEGGQWFMFRDLVKKYGLVPAEVMPETYAAADSGNLNQCLNFKLRAGAAELKRLWEGGASQQELRAYKETILEAIYRILCCTLGTPPRSFRYEYYDRDGQYHILAEQTPMEYAKSVLDHDLDDYITVANYPTKDKPFRRVYQIPGHKNMEGGGPALYYNLEMADIKSMLIRQLQDGEGIWFGCDCMKMMDRQQGVMSRELYDYEGLFGVPFHMEKGDMLDFFQSEPNHNMTITGVDLVDGKPTRWKVENSWGSEVGHGGFYVMDDSFLEHYAFLFVLHKRCLTPEQLADLEQTPIPLPSWDPMGI